MPMDAGMLPDGYGLKPEPETVRSVTVEPSETVEQVIVISDFQLPSHMFLEGEVGFPLLSQV